MDFLRNIPSNAFYTHNNISQVLRSCEVPITYAGHSWLIPQSQHGIGILSKIASAFLSIESTPILIQIIYNLASDGDGITKDYIDFLSGAISGMKSNISDWRMQYKYNEAQELIEFRSFSEHVTNAPHTPLEINYRKYTADINRKQNVQKIPNLNMIDNTLKIYNNANFSQITNQLYIILYLTDLVNAEIDIISYKKTLRNFDDVRYIPEFGLLTIPVIFNADELITESLKLYNLKFFSKTFQQSKYESFKECSNGVPSVIIFEFKQSNNYHRLINSEEHRYIEKLKIESLDKRKKSTF
ncbi:hypothetical protein SNEBB_001710 [Seison nebaliae]|nr:hypothetical protein SNEBB_001710 [Seison nebaliae]